jgi:hypothetical protein
MASFKDPSVIFIAIDVSESMNICEPGGNSRIENLKSSVFNLVSSLSAECDPSTHVILEKFSDASETVYDGPLDGLQLANEWEKFRTNGSTCLYYVVHKGIDLLLNHKNSKKFFVCATDGINTVKPEYQGVSQLKIKEAAAKGVNVYYIGNDKFTCESGTAQMGIRKEDVYEMEGCSIPPTLCRAISTRAKSANEPPESFLEETGFGVSESDFVLPEAEHGAENAVKEAEHGQESTLQETNQWSASTVQEAEQKTDVLHGGSEPNVLHGGSEPNGGADPNGGSEPNVPAPEVVHVAAETNVLYPEDGGRGLPAQVIIDLTNEE